jgi:asparagine synthase (glutamine-hydrolysing)
MCGILGSFSVFPSTRNLTAFERGLDRLMHRGPNDRGSVRLNLDGSELILGHTRLSIIDLTSGGHQPRESKCGRYILIFNGEIYNYRELRVELQMLGCIFQTESDTEVLLAAWIEWREDCLSRLIGMFSFAVFDRAESSLFCARDSFGIKPFFYSYNNDFFYFGSEIHAIIELSEQKLEPNYQTAYNYLVSGLYDNGPNTFFEGVTQLLPGHHLRVKLDGKQIISTERWFWPPIEQTSQLSYKDAAEKFRSLFLDSIRLHLRSDVPLATALSC